MESLAALSLVANIIQVVNAATDAATICYQIYKLGASIEDLQITYTSDQLHQCYTTLSNSVQANQTHTSLPSGIDLKSLSEECCKSADILHKELKALQKSGGRGSLKAIENFVRRKRKAGEIQRLRERLEEHQKTLDTRVLVDIRQTITVLFSQQSNRDTNVDQKLSELTKDLSSCQISIANTLKTAIDKAIEADKHEHEVTRTHIQSHFDSTVHALTTNQAQQLELQKRQDRFLESLRFDDINVRKNEIFEPTTRTFDWIFEDEMSKSWDSLSTWLKQGQRIYWINGKAGSGKSTLMRFIVKDERTSNALDIWAGGKDHVVLEFYFWLSGSKFQRSMKGFLCSFLRQVMSNNRDVLEDVFRKNGLMTRKRAMGDWSHNELRTVLQFAMESLSRTSNVCVFLDGLDEFDQDEDIQDLLGLVEELKRFQHIKFCVSSRPDAYLEKRLSQYEQLRLQDLTAEDMEIYIRGTLGPIYEKYPPKSIKEEDIRYFIDLMAEKADGVFLWVNLALKSLLLGLKREEDFQMLLVRLEELPSGIKELYQQMWNRLNGDEQRYREQASTYFSYHQHFPLSLFEMMVALDGVIQTKYLQDLVPQDPTEVIDKCEILKTRILTRCAGLLEVATVMYNDNDTSSIATDTENIEPTTSRSASTEELAQNIEPQRGNEEQACDNTNEVPPPPSAASNISPKAHSIAHRKLQDYYNVKVKFMHRTARDFLLNTQAGYAIAGEASQSHDERFVDVTKARMASLLQGLIVFDGKPINDIIESVGNSDTECEIELLSKLYQVCKALSIPGAPDHNINFRWFWNLDSYASDFVGLAAYSGCVKYVRNFVEVEIEYLSPYYRGYLFLKTVEDLGKAKRLQLASWLAQNGADISTKQLSKGPWIETPFQRLLSEAIDPEYYSDPTSAELATQTAQFIESIYPSRFKSTEPCVVYLGATDEWPPDTAPIYVEMDANSLSRMAIGRLGRLGATVESTRLEPSRPNNSLRVLSLREKGESQMIFCPNFQDSIYLGQAYDKILFPEDYSDTLAQSWEDFRLRVQEALPRCEQVDRKEWQIQMGIRVDLPRNALTLDPSEDVDEINWREKGKGWFRTAAIPTKEKPESTGSPQVHEETT